MAQTSYINQQGHQVSFDVLIIGSGLAGLKLALNLTQKEPTLKIALLAKASLRASNSYAAQGGIAISTSEEDIKRHAIDTIKAGDGLCHRPAVNALLAKAPSALRAFEQYKVPFYKNDHNQYDLGIEGGHSNRRIYHCGDKSGQSIIDCLLHQLNHHTNIQCFTRHIAVNLITKSPSFKPQSAKSVLGAYVLDERSELIHTFLAKATVLATGGAGKTYRYTSNPSVATGDGVAMAARANALITNMEFYQFHPTLLYHPKLNNFLISEALRGEGAKLLNAETGAAFMAKYQPQHKELATRDVVSRAIFSEIESSNVNHVYLDISHKDQAFLAKRFPKIFHSLNDIGIDISRDPIPVVPAAHYQCGGVIATPNGETSLKRLFAIGEVACTGFHGANRLASNSLLESSVMGLLSCDKILALCRQTFNPGSIRAWESGSYVNPRRASQISAHWKGLRQEMSSYAGIIRTEAGLKDVLTLVQTRKKIVEDYYWKHCITRDLVELRNIILVAELIIKAAIKRRDSHGGHYREDP
jgi:L-aspartate oxidase